MGNCMCKYACFHHSREPRMWACCAQFADQLREPSKLGTLILVDHEKDFEIESRESFLESSDGDDRCLSFHLQVSARTGSHTLHLGLPPELPHYSGVGIVRDKVDGLPEADLFALERFSKSFEVCTDCWPLCPCEHKHVFLSSKRRSLQDCFDIAALMNGADKNAVDRIKVSISRTHLRVYAVTWNMNGKKSALQDLVKLALSLDHEQYDMFVVGLQEVPSCDAESLLVGAFGEGHSLVARATLLSLQLFIISRRILRAYFEDVKVDKVGGGGFGGVVRRQKGAVAVSFKFKDAAFLFIASHLSPHENNVEERNSQFQRISQSLFSSRSPSPRLSSCLNASPVVDDDTPSCNGSEMPVAISGSLATSSPAVASAVEDADLVVWLGDLNYRIQDHRSLVDALITQSLYKPLWHKDQLSREIERGHVFKGFREGPLSFRPTYKYDVGTDNYDTSPKERVPSWTDRILYKVKDGLIKVDVCDYDAIGCIKSSDHRPVKAVFTLSPW